MENKITIYDVEADKFNTKLAEELKEIKEFKMPEWAEFVKTGMSKKRVPYELDWWYKRVASILRQIYIKGTVGVNRLRIRYGGKKDRGAKPKRFKRAGGKIIRFILQKSEETGLLKKSEGKKKGRQMTKKGLDFLNSIAKKIKAEGIKNEESKKAKSEEN